MSTTCPQCGTSIDQDFGVATCSKCQAVLFIDMEGNAKATDSQEIVHPVPPFEELPSEEAPAFQEAWMQDQEPDLQEDLQQVHDVVYEDPDEIAPEPEPEPESKPVNPGDLSEVSDFANSDQAFGPLSYSVIIENIDTKEIRTQLLEALGDSKFAWDPKELLKKVKLGKLTLEDLNPVKASVLVQRLQEVPVKVSWVQNVYS